MAYLRLTKRGKMQYYYICTSIRKGSSVRTKVLEYLGRDPDPKRLKKALEYWGVRTKRRARSADRR